jgi:DMSO/TMAO reductase YedYZ molybdopterin-dependent catalytic subunit
MNRRQLMMLVGYGTLGSLNRAFADHHVISADPLIVTSDLASETGRYTPLDDFYVRNHGIIPPPSDAISVVIDGLVGKPRTFAGSDLISLAKEKVGAVLECAGSPLQPDGLASNGLWSGFALRSLLAKAGIMPGPTYLHLQGRDGYARSVPTGQAWSEGILVTHLNGEPLRPRHGAPLRVVFPGSYGMNSVKWLEKITVASEPLLPNGDDYLERRQGSEPHDLPKVQVKSLITYPKSRSVVRSGSIIVRGVAWSGEAAVSAVEISSDGGVHWRNAVLDAGGGHEWVLWQSTLELLRPGVVELVCRATDSRGQTQPAERDPARLDGYTNNWYHRVQVVVE